MKTSKEKATERKLINEMRSRGGVCWKLIPLHVTGLPDRLCLYPPGRVFFAEVKDSTKSLKPKQNTIRKLLLHMGFKHYIVDEYTDLASLL